MTAKTLRNKGGGTDYTRGVSREQRGINRRNKLESSSSISSRSCYRKPNWWRNSIKLSRQRKAFIDFDNKRCAIDEERFGEHEFIVREVPSIPFEEKQFGHAVAKDKEFYKTRAGDLVDLSSIIVSLALFDGDKILFACSGICVPDGRPIQQLARFVTSTCLVTKFKEHRYRDDNLRIAVRLPNNMIIDGFLGLYDEQIAIVTSISHRHIDTLDRDLRAAPKPGHNDYLVLAAGRAFTEGCFMATLGSLRWSKECLEARVSEITEAAIGGPIIGVRDGRFLGMNLKICDGDSNVTSISFLPSKLLWQRLKHFQILNRKKVHFRGYSLPSNVSRFVPTGFLKYIYRQKSLGYPMPPPLVLEFNGELLNTFEEGFGEFHAWKGCPFPFHNGDPDVVWGKLRNEVVTNISRSVVSLTSSNGYVRSFACTGLLIKWPISQPKRTVILTSASLISSRYKGEDIDNDLTIEVFLPPNQRCSGKLEFYNLNHNIAVVSVMKNLNAIRPVDIFSEVPKSFGKVVAVGRDVTFGVLMGTIGEVKRTTKYRKLDCKDVRLSTCKITKAGIGGPLINFNGNFVGMNFYDGSKVTPFMPRDKIVEVLSSQHCFSLLPSECGYYEPIPLQDIGGVSKKNKYLLF